MHIKPDRNLYKSVKEINQIPTIIYHQPHNKKTHKKVKEESRKFIELWSVLKDVKFNETQIVNKTSFTFTPEAKILNQT